MSQTEIARELQVSIASISLDMQYLRSQAKESIKEYVAETPARTAPGMCHGFRCDN